MELDFDLDSTKIDAYKLILLGVLLCRGNIKVRARILYDILQDNLADRITASDHQFEDVFHGMVTFSTVLLPEVAEKC